jgi:hypothetical protein
VAETTTKVGGDFVMVSNRLFIKLHSIGMCDGDGRTVFASHFKGKIVADADRPIRTLLLPVMQEVLDYAKYTDRAEFDADLAALKRYVDGLYLKGKKTDNPTETCEGDTMTPPATCPSPPPPAPADRA